MRTLRINKRKIYYAERIFPDETNEYGEVKPRYGNQKKCKINVQYRNPNLSVREFGLKGDCDAVMIADLSMVPFKENTVFWIDNKPTEPYDYVMTELPNKTINGVVYRIRKVNVSN